MKVGTDSPIKTGIAVALLAIGLLLVVRWMISSGATPVAKVAPTTSSPRTGPRVNSLDPTLRTDLLRDSEQTQYETKGRNIFVAQVEIPQVQKPVIQKPPEPLYTGPPTPPPIDIKFFGFASKPGEAKKVFLSQGEDIFVAKEGEVINRRYKVLKISPNSVEIEDVLSNNRQSIPLTQG